jgi:hypothetical protein
VGARPVARLTPRTRGGRRRGWRSGPRHG